MYGITRSDQFNKILIGALRSVAVCCNSELVVGAVLGLACNPERGWPVPGQQRNRQYDDESSPGRSRSVASEDGGDERDRETARQSHYLG